MADTSKVKQYFKECFSKKMLIEKGIIAGAALVLVLIFSLSFYFWLKNEQPGVPIGKNGFWYLEVVWNNGVGWNALENNPAAIYAIQSIMFIVLLAIYLLLCQDRITSSFVALAMFGGLFNLFQRVGSGTNAVLDYFRFGFWETFPTFNWPDMFVVIGIFGFVITYITLTIIEAVRESRHDKVTKAKQEEKHDQPKQ